MPADGESKYWAFISYSHADKAWGDWLHRALETYRVPKRLVGTSGRDGEIPARLFPIFRDREELPVSASLPENISFALEQSRYLIVICSPRSAASRWVNEEIMTFKRLGREDHVLALIVNGEPNASEDGGKPGFLPSDECFPPALRYRLGGNDELSSERTEPIAADARPDKDGKSNAKLKLLAGLLQVDYDQLKQREHERRVRRLRVIIGATLVLVGSLSGLTIYSILQRQRAENALAQGDKLIEYMIGELETGRLDSGKNQEVLKSINTQIVDYYNALPEETRKSKGDLQRRFAELLRAKSALLQGDLDEAKRIMRDLQSAAQGTPAGMGEAGDPEHSLQSGREILALAVTVMAGGQTDVNALRESVDTLRRAPAQAGGKFAAHSQLALKLALLADLPSEQGPEEAAKLAREAITNAERLAADIDDDVRADAAAKRGKPSSEAMLQSAAEEIKFIRSIAYGALGSARQESGKSDEALEAFRQCLQATREFGDSPTFGSFGRYEAATMQSEIGSILQSQNKLDEAMASFQAALDPLEALIKADGSNLLWLAAHADALEKLAALLDQQGKTEEALTKHRVRAGSLPRVGRVESEDPALSQQRIRHSRRHRRHPVQTRPFSRRRGKLRGGRGQPATAPGDHPGRHGIPRDVCSRRERSG